MLQASLVFACALSPLALLVWVLRQVAAAILQTVFVVALLGAVVALRVAAAVLIALALRSAVAKFVPSLLTTQSKGELWLMQDN